MMEFDNDLAPIVGQQITVSAISTPMVEQRIALFEQRASTPFTSKLLGGEVTECDLIATGIIDGVRRGYLFDSKTQLYRSDKANQQQIDLAQLLAAAKALNNTLTFTCTVPGKGWQSALDRDLNGILNANEEK